jgi:hypothetical protein
MCLPSPLFGAIALIHVNVFFQMAGNIVCSDAPPGASGVASA